MNRLPPTACREADGHALAALEAAAGRRIAELASQSGVTFGALEPVDSVTDVVFRSTIAVQRVIVKCALAGVSKVRLLARLRGEDPSSARHLANTALLHNRTAPSTAEASYHTLATSTHGSTLTVPEVLFTSANVIAIRDLAPAKELDRIAVAPDLTQLWQFLALLWEHGRASSDYVRQINRAHRHSIESIFERKFHPSTYLGYLATLQVDPHARSSLGALVETLHYQRRRPRGRYRMIYGDLKPEHVLIGPDAEISVIDPALHYATPEADVARFLGRYATSPEFCDSHRIAIERMDAANGPLSGLDRELITHLLIMDWLNITTTRLTAGYPETGKRRESTESVIETSQMFIAGRHSSTADPIETALRLADSSAEGSSS